jgi:chromosomal replication initiator protein
MDLSKNNAGNTSNVSISESKLWQSILHDLREKIDNTSYMILNSLEEVYYNEGNIYIYTPDNIYKNWIETEILETIETSANKVIGRNVKIHVISLKDKSSKKTKKSKNSKNFEETDFYQYLSLNPKYTFDNLIVGNNNKVAFQACLAATENLGKIYNPLFIYGDVGLGKTHLLQGTAYYVLAKNSTAKIIYTTADTFASEFFSYLEKGMILEFRKKYREVDLLLIDDIQFLVGKERTQIEFYHIFNVLYSLGKQIILSSDQPPSKLNGIEKRLISRFSSGLIVEITKPDLETKINITLKKMKELNVEFSRDVVLFIAKTVNTSVRELEGSIKRLKAYSEIMGRPITLDVARTVLKDVLEVNEVQPLTVERIQKEVCNYFNIDIKELLGNSRNKKSVTARQIAMYLSKELTDESLSSIARYFHKKDHTTILNAANKIKEMMEKDRKLKYTVDLIKDKLITL